MVATTDTVEYKGTYRWDDIPDGVYLPIYNLKCHPDMLSEEGYAYTSYNKSENSNTEIILDSNYAYFRISKLLSELGLREVKDVDRFLKAAKTYHCESAEREYNASLVSIAKSMVLLHGGDIQGWVTKLKEMAK